LSPAVDEEKLKKEKRSNKENRNQGGKGSGVVPGSKYSEMERLRSTKRTLAKSFRTVKGCDWVISSKLFGMTAQKA